jgi:hypothetical protein
MSLGIRGRLPVKKLALSAGLLLVGVTSVGMFDSSLSCGDNCRRNPFGVEFARAFTNDDGVVNDSSRDPSDNGIDPGNGKPVASCVASIISSSAVRVTIQNGYPGYVCRLWVKIRNSGCRDVRRTTASISAPSALAVTEVSPRQCYVLRPGNYRYEVYDARVLQSAREMTTYTFTVRIPFTESRQGCGGCR